MTTTSAAGVDTWEMVMAHRLYRREFRILPAIIRGVPDGDRTRAAAVGDHLHLVTTMLHHHHEAEDALLWPIMRDRAGLHAGVVQRMESQHERLESLLHRLGELNDAWRTSGAAPVGDELADVLAQASPVLDEHLDDEERDLLPLVPPHVSQREWDALNARARGSRPKDLRTAFVALGAMLEDATADEQRRFMTELPPPVRMLWRLAGRRSYARSRDRVRRG